MIEPFNLPGCEFLDTFEFRFAAATVITTVMMWLVARIRDRLLGTPTPIPTPSNLVATKTPLPMVTPKEVMAFHDTPPAPELSQEAKDWILLLEDPCRPWRLEDQTTIITLDDTFQAIIYGNAAVLFVKKKADKDWTRIEDLFTYEEKQAISKAAVTRYQSLKHFKDQNDRRARLGVEKEVMAQAFSFRGRGV